MRLIDTTTLALKEFFSDSTPPYAILSHTWEEEEVTFQDWADRALVFQKNGYQKIVKTCQLAKEQGYGYVWVDTNCIDKSSSSELSEAINSMFNWYQSAQICYVYLSDIPSSMMEDLSECFRRSRWFKRGWTLQELLAPREIEFYGHDWSFLGTKMSLYSDISLASGIDVQYLWRKHVSGRYLYDDYVLQSIEFAIPLRKASVAERFSWLSNRSTTRPEDLAYCMLGIFDLSMPLLYGEGLKAFRRLQEEIMKGSDDHSLFCWTSTAFHDRGSFLSSLPSGFAGLGNFHARQEQRPSPHSLTNAGLSITLPILRCWTPSHFIGILQVTSDDDDAAVFGLPMLGNIKTGRVHRGPFPPAPIRLCDGPLRCEEIGVFVSEKYSQLDTQPFPMFSSTSKKTKRDSLSDYNTAVLVTFEPRSAFVEIETCPPYCFDKSESCIRFQRRDRDRTLDLFWAESSPSFRVNDSEGILIQLKLPDGKFTFFMVSSTRSWSEDWSEDWKWHCWRVPSKDATILQSRDPKTRQQAMYRALKAVEDPNFAQSIDRETGPSNFSISMAKGYWSANKSALCHMHLSWSPPA